ncbi:MucR family transcriptional regulator [Methylorubrum zatmanii]|jgi:predicted transcriptional regulator|uniref:MucR family transcriptional regulator n=1 Tax=Methylorubrum extorquens TaxID=408 RepID=UPI0006F7E050|nr:MULTISPECIES: MucR family transcriptional regulator [Methylorubrum]ARO53808.1 MucR family transcriptional regulator [Methylorubrum zatmanii]KQO92028.1 MucR family transcriptional regulator [Methylobacterium sp. Leaf92]MCG5246945.1 MucR family transcriptional regulator [Methylorubrum extorquens]
MPNDNVENIATNGVDIIDLTTAIVEAYVTNNTLPSRNLPGLIAGVHAALAALGNAGPVPPADEEVEKPTPAQIRKSITPDAITSFVDGRPYKTLKRHLSANGLDPHAYRRRYGLPSDYPMTATSYSERRSALAKSNRLGRS